MRLPYASTRRGPRPTAVLTARAPPSLAEQALSAKAEPLNVVVHPIVLLNAVDHYNRVARDTKRRVVGILLGEISRVRAIPAAVPRATPRA
jgi:hypothetical protein